MQIYFFICKISGSHEKGVLSNKVFERFEFQKKKWSQICDENFEKLLLRKFFHNKLQFFMSNLNVECFQLSFDMHIVHVGQK